MEYPCLVWLLGLAFLPLALVAVFQRPPLTPRGRLFYVLAGLMGLAAGAHWLFLLALQHGLVAVRPDLPRPLASVVADMLSTDYDRLGTLLAGSFCAAGTASCLWAIFGPEHRETDEDA